jgi:D-alanyl-D-alanine carboxypeptidase/D-alanyl-D-alanine-endopeptidase (penicillin-binding protein 4)
MSKLIATLFCTLLLLNNSFPQNVSERLKLAVKRLETDSQMKHAILSLYVADAATGEVVFEKNATIGLAPASCQKLFTSAAALEILGAGYRYKTTLGYDGSQENGLLDGNLYITGSGDPTLGSKKNIYRA